MQIKFHNHSKVTPKNGRRNKNGGGELLLLEGEEGTGEERSDRDTNQLKQILKGDFKDALESDQAPFEAVLEESRNAVISKS